MYVQYHTYRERKETIFMGNSYSCLNRRKQLQISGVEARIQNPRNGVDWEKIQDDNECINMSYMANYEVPGTEPSPSLF